MHARDSSHILQPAQPSMFSGLERNPPLADALHELAFVGRGNRTEGVYHKNFLRNNNYYSSKKYKTSFLQIYSQLFFV